LRSTGQFRQGNTQLSVCPKTQKASRPHSVSIFSGAENSGRLDLGYSGNNFCQTIQIGPRRLKRILSLHFLVSFGQHVLHKIAISQNAFIAFVKNFGFTKRLDVQPAAGTAQQTTTCQIFSTTQLDSFCYKRTVSCSCPGAFCCKQTQHFIHRLPWAFDPAHQSTVTTERIGVQLLQVTNNICSMRVEMDVQDQFLEIGFLLTKNRLVAVLKMGDASNKSRINTSLRFSVHPLFQILFYCA